MVLADRDYMRERHRNTSEHARRWGEREPSASRTLWNILFFLAVIFLGYKLAAWRDSHRAARPMLAAPALSAPAAPAMSKAPAAPAPQAGSPAVHQYLTGNSDPNRAIAPGALEPAATTIVIKCVINGMTTYAESESACHARAKATVVTIDRRQNLSDGLPSAPEIIRRSQMAQVDAAPTGPDSNMQRQALCQAYEQEIKWIDERARQPLSGQEQDWLAAKRKKARDGQFRLHC